jgi:hypothetical protein
LIAAGILRQFHLAEFELASQSCSRVHAFMSCRFAALPSSSLWLEPPRPLRMQAGMMDQIADATSALHESQIKITDVPVPGLRAPERFLASRAAPSRSFPRSGTLRLLVDSLQCSMSSAPLLQSLRLSA